jgi:protein-S-isoprenylcysteine O-methyltransferase Ste14
MGEARTGEVPGPASQPAVSLAPRPAPPLARWLAALAHHLSEDFLGGPRPLRLAAVINFQKGGTLPFVAALMAWYGNGSAEAWVYLALHGTYGLAWLLKDLAFRDRRWEVRVTLGGAFMAFALVLGPYWLFPWLLISGVLGPRLPAPGWLLALAVGVHTLGLAVMVAADAQKNFLLRVRSGLIQDGLFARTRNPNYLGEMMVYAAYALLVRHWLPWLVLGIIWSLVFLPYMLMKEASLSRYPEWAAYRARTGLLLPRLRRRGG